VLMVWPVVFSSTPGASQPEMKKLGLDDLANDPANVNFRKAGNITISNGLKPSYTSFLKGFYQASWLNTENHPCYRQQLNPFWASGTPGVWKPAPYTQSRQGSSF
jgi:hypothetical protein